MDFEMECFSSKERRIVNIVAQHWGSIKESYRDWPERCEIDTAEIMESWQHCFIIEVRDQGYVCENAGEKAVEFYGFKKEMYVDDKHVMNAPFLWLYKMDAVIDKFDAIVDSKRLINEEEEGENIKIRQILLPLGNKEGITHILGVITFKLF